MPQSLTSPSRASRMMRSASATGTGSVTPSSLDSWADAVRRHEPKRVAAYFTEDAIFQGFDRTPVVGRAGVAAYYDKQPVGLTLTYTVLQTRAFSEDTFLAFVDIDFIPPNAAVIPVHLTVALVRSE